MQELSATQTALLKLLSKALFETEVNILCSDWKALYREANVHKVFPLVFSVSKAYVADEVLLQKAEKLARHSLATTVSLNYAHAELHRLMQKENIPYVTFKGLASSLYYPQPELRNAGDVDFYVHPADFAHCEAVLQREGFTCSEHEGKHAAYQKDGIVLELHRSLNGIPENALGEQMKQDVFGDLIENAETVDIGQGKVNIPDTFHHGMILLLHTLSHMTTEGIGLRHLCDWAVFESSLTNEEFLALFEKRLKEYGLWRFAQLLSLCVNRYLQAPIRAWHGEVDSVLLEKMVCDLFAAGNFGLKDTSRRQQIKFIVDRGDKTVRNVSASQQIRQVLKKKAEIEKKSKTAIIIEYINNVIKGKRRIDTRKTLETAAERKALYSEFHLYEPEE
ncbi:MAG: nucleotidyltransferase family protein [Clostridia bacterium]|nr:nucleotidyltransferase family protein [Clostridia bacterium]